MKINEKSNRSRDRATKGKEVGWRHIFHNNVYSFRFMLAHSKVNFVLHMIDVILIGLYTPVNLFVTAKLFMALENSDFDGAIRALIVMAIILTLRIVWDTLFRIVLTPWLRQLLHMRIQTQLFEKAKQVELSKYDHPDHYNAFILAMENADTYATGAMTNLASLLKFCLTFIATIGLLSSVDFTTMLIILISAVLSMVITSKIKRIEYHQKMDITPIQKKGQYIDRVYSLPNYSKEFRLTELGNKLEADFDKNTEDHIAVEKKYGILKLLPRMLSIITADGVYMAVIGLALYSVVITGSIPLGGLAIVINANWKFREALIQLAETISALPQQSLFMEKVRTFMEYMPPHKEGTLPVPVLEKIELRGVQFEYKVDQPVLRNVHMKIHRGERIAFVGYNGAGKTTLIKLLMGLYQPKSGEILYNDVNISKLDFDEYLTHIGVVFQDFKLFAVSLAENVLADEYTEDKKDAVEQALYSAVFDARLEKLPRGLHTMLAREFDEYGVDLSGGEAQKVAIARAFAKQCELIIMDEPSAALDPIAEYELNQRINKYARGKTMITISHRLSTTRNADRIYLFEKGEIIEYGTHEQLMEMNGKYAELYTVQAEKYTGENNGEKSIQEI